MTREDILQNPGYWEQSVLLEISQHVLNFMGDNNMDATQFATYVEMPKMKVKKILNAEYDFKISELIKLCLKIRFTLTFDFMRKNKIIDYEQFYL